MADDVIQISILEDGTIRSETDTISPANHSSASAFFKLMAELAGGPQERARRSTKNAHAHEHKHEEQHS